MELSMMLDHSAAPRRAADAAAELEAAGPSRRPGSSKPSRTGSRGPLK